MLFRSEKAGSCHKAVLFGNDGRANGGIGLENSVGCKIGSILVQGYAYGGKEMGQGFMLKEIFKGRCFLHCLKGVVMLRSVAD